MMVYEIPYVTYHIHVSSLNKFIKTYCSPRAEVKISIEVRIPY